MAKDKTKENIEWLEKAVEQGYGKKCKDFQKECWCCRAWEFFNEIKNYYLPTCDWRGKCKNKAFREVYPKLSKINKKGWSFLCRKHFYQELKKFGKEGKKLAWAGLEEFEKVRNYKPKKHQDNVFTLL